MWFIFVQFSTTFSSHFISYMETVQIILWNWKIYSAFWEISRVRVRMRKRKRELERERRWEWKKKTETRKMINRNESERYTFCGIYHIGTQLQSCIFVLFCAPELYQGSLYNDEIPTIKTRMKFQKQKKIIFIICVFLFLECLIWEKKRNIGILQNICTEKNRIKSPVQNSKVCLYMKSLAHLRHYLFHIFFGICHYSDPIYVRFIIHLGEIRFLCGIL